MDPQLLQHLLALSAKTGDRLIIAPMDIGAQQPFVLMGLAQYERLAVPSPAAPPAPSAPGAGRLAPVASDARTPDDLVRAANDALAAWRAEEGILEPAAPVAPPVPAAAGYTPEPIEAVPLEERFYVEPLE